MNEAIFAPAKFRTSSMFVETMLSNIKAIEITILSPITLHMHILPVDFSTKRFFIFGKSSRVSPIANGKNTNIIRLCPIKTYLK